MKKPAAFLFRASLVAGLTSLSLHAATAPFSETFDGVAPGNNLPPDFVEGGSIGTNVSGNNSLITVESDTPTAGNDYQFNVTGAGSLFSLVSLTNVAGFDFTLSVELTIDSTSGVGTNFATGGLLALDNPTTPTNGYRLLFNPIAGSSSAGRLSLQEGGVNIANSVLNFTLGALGTVYTLTLSGTYAIAGDPTSALTLNGSVDDVGNVGTAAVTVSAIDSTSVQAGTGFGLRTAATGGALNADYDNFTALVVPEPTTIVTLLSGAACLGLVRRRRR